MIDEIEVQQVIGRYARAHDRRDGDAMAALFTPDGEVELRYNDRGSEVPLAKIAGRDAIRHAVTAMMKPHPERGWSHNAVDGLLVEVNGDSATVDAQYMVFRILAAEKPPTGWPVGTTGSQGTITPIESGYYRQQLIRVEGRWLIRSLTILQNLPVAYDRRPGA